jgi:hypothetical protein
MRSLYITDLEYGGHSQEIWNFGQFLPQTNDFRLNRRLTQIDFERKFEIFKTHKNSYAGPSFITDLEYGGHG